MIYHCVEPHSDDAFLSLHQHMVNWLKAGDRVVIHTLIAVARNSMKEAEEYAQSIGAEWQGYPLERRERGSSTGWDAVRIPKDGQLILPIAVKHPDHVEARQYLDRPRAWYYCDMPYSCTQSSSERVTELLAGTTVVSYVKPGVRKYKNCAIFKAQSKFFYFNPPADLQENFELIVKGGVPWRRP